ncbi:DUF4279 domain-containing protein [Streptomyces griseorubiginosus]|uniref:DUF4279 domain-containing protein n=1 Tax=Streptomyces griseorubiginosus TaxID=67304 RepID=UPI0033B93204
MSEPGWPRVRTARPPKGAERSTQPWPRHEVTSSYQVTPPVIAAAFRGSRFTEPAVVPVDHSWMVVCRDPGLRVDEQIARVLDRLQPHTDRISDLTRKLAAAGGGVAVAPDLLGWHLDRRTLDFLGVTGAELDADEYDMADGDEAR